MSIFFNYSVGRLILQTSNNKKFFIVIGITTNLCALGYFKYANFFSTTLFNLLKVSASPISVLLPLGISFFTFTQIAYLVDCYRNQIPKYRFMDYCLFVTFFPHLIAGPILHHGEIIPQFKQSPINCIKFQHFVIGLSIFTLGLFKKVIFADGIAQYANPIFDAAQNGISLTFSEAWTGALAYSLQLYFDFSGYSDMAIGLAYLFNIRFPLNFNSPYKANNIIDFWHRWHMTLSRFLRNYLYIPLGGNRNGKFNRYLNLIITMTLGGLWHGAGWTFIVWGLLHGVYLTINHGWQEFKKNFNIQSLNRPLREITARTITFLAVVLAWVFFRANNVHAALSQIFSMVGLRFLNKETASFSANSATSINLHNGAILIFILLFIIWALPNTCELFEPLFSPIKTYTKNSISTKKLFHLSWKPPRTWAIGLGMVSCWTILNLGHVSEFLYFQF